MSASQGRGAGMSRHRTTLAAKDYAEVERLTREGMSARQIAAVLGCARDTIYSIRSDRGATIAACCPLTDAQRDQIRDLTAAGLTCAQIAERTGARVHQVRDTRSRHGWYSPRPAAVGLRQKLGARTEPQVRAPEPDPEPECAIPANPTEGSAPTWRERDIWCRRAHRCLDDAADRHWAALSCVRCERRGRDQEDTAERLRGIALMQAVGPEVGTKEGVA